MKSPLFAMILFASMGIAWWVKSEATSGRPTVTPLRTRTERPVSHTAIDIQRVKEAGDDGEKLRVLMSELAPEEIPALLASLQSRGDMTEQDISDRIILRKLIVAWQAKDPDAALAWVVAMKGDWDRRDLLQEIALAMASTDMEAGLSLLRQHASNAGNFEDDFPTFYPCIFYGAVKQGANRLLEVSRLTIGSDWSTGLLPDVGYPEDFDFQRALDGLAEAQAAYGEDGQFKLLPDGLLRQWAIQDPQAALAWLQQGKKFNFNGPAEFFKGYARVAKPEEVGALMASAYAPAISPTDRYQTVWEVLTRYEPAPSMLDSFLRAIPGDRTTHLNGLLDQSSGGHENIDKARAMILERMDPTTRVDALQRIFVERGVNEWTRQSLTPVLRELGRGDDEIQSMLPPRINH